MTSIKSAYEMATSVLIAEYAKLQTEDPDNELLRFIEVKEDNFRYVNKKLKDFLSRFSEQVQEPELNILLRYRSELKRANELCASKPKSASGLELRF